MAPPHDGAGGVDAGFRDRAAAVHAALFLVSLLFGGNYVVAKFALREITPLGLVVLRTAIATVVLFTAAYLHRPSLSLRTPFSRHDMMQLIVFGLLGAALNQFLFLEGLARTTATNAAIMLLAGPVLTLAFAVALRRERPSLTGMLGVALGLSGALVMILPRGGIDISSRSSVGNLLLLFSSASYALYLVLTRPILSRHDPLRVVSWVFLFAFLWLAPFGTADVAAVTRTGLSRDGWLAVAYVAVGGTALPYLLNNWALVRVKSSTVAVYILVQPLVAATLGRIFLGDRLGPQVAIAAPLIVAGLVLATWRRGPAESIINRLRGPNPT